MAKQKGEEQDGNAAEINARLITSPEDKVKANKWFLRARELGDKRQFDYAIEYLVNGLEFWPDAVEEACKPLHGCAVARRQTGGKKPGLKDTMKRSLSDKNAKQAYLNSLWLFAHDPDNPAYLEAVARNASRLRAEDASQWAIGVYLKALESNPKSANKLFVQLCVLSEEIGDRATARREAPFAMSVYQLGIEALNICRRRGAKEQTLDDSIRNLSTKITILKGKYKDSESYRDSIADVDQQRDLHDEQRSVQADSRVEELIRKAQLEYEAAPDDAAKVRSYIDILCRRERDDEEKRAIGILVHEYKRTENYRFKQSADDIRIKQLSRLARETAKTGDEAAIKERSINQLRFELSVFKERTERYPTDNRLKFEYAVRNFRAGRFDDAIPLFQTARSDPKNRASCGLYLGRCFFRKGYFPQSISSLQEAREGHEIADDDLAKELLYWLGRALEGAGRTQEARVTLGKLLQLDYNYRDVRARMDVIPS